MRGLILIACLIVVGCAGEDADVEETSEAVTPTSEAVELESTDAFQADNAGLGPRDQLPGADLYGEHCAMCHDGSVPKAPHLIFLELMSPGAVLASMNGGIMRSQAAALSAEERSHIAEFITMKRVGESSSAQLAPRCDGPAAEFDKDALPPKVGWGHDTARYSGPDVAGMEVSDIPNLKLKWAFAYPNALRARSQPAVGYGAVYAGSHDGTVYALDLDTGCVRWTFSATAEVRTAVVLTDGADGEPPLAVFGDILARLYAVDAFTGELVWSLKADDHPSATLTGSPALADNKLFVPVSSLEVTAAADPSYECCSFRGSVLALEVATGKLLWRHYTIPEEPKEIGVTSVGTRALSPSGAPTWTTPAVDRKRNLVYIGTGGNYSSPADEHSDAIIAIDMTSGERAWQRQSTAGDAWNVACMMANNPNCPEEDGPDFDHGSSMILADLPDGKQVLTAGDKKGTVFGLDPDDEGALLWATEVGRGSIQGGVHFGMAVEGDTIYVPINDMNNTYEGSVLDPEKARPGMHALDAQTGDIKWSHIQEDVCPDSLQYCDPGISAAVTAISGAVFAGHLDGFLRAYARDTGKVLWEFDTKEPVDAVNGETAKGGGMSGSGPTIVDGHLIVNSGYGLYFHEPGNMLAVFTVNGE